MSAAVRSTDGAHPLLRQPWVQLAAVIVCQLAVSSVQFTWTLFVLPIQTKYHWSEAAIQGAASVLGIAQCFVSPLIGYATGRLTHRVLMLSGGVLMGASWVVDASASSLPALYVGGLLGGAAYATVQIVGMAHVMKWFPERRGLVVGVTSGAVTAGAMLMAFPIAHMIGTGGYEATFQRFGTLLSAGIIGAGALLTARPGLCGTSCGPSTPPRAGSLTLGCALGSRVFQVLYVLTIVAFFGGMFVTAHLAAIGSHFQVDTRPISWHRVTMTVLPVALSAGLLFDSVAAALFGWLSDRFTGRAPLLFVIAFLLQAGSLGALPLVARTPAGFVLTAALAQFGWGALFGVFPVLPSDLFGPTFAVTMCSWLWTGKVFASLLLPIGGWLAAGGGGWERALTAAAGLDVVAAVLAFRFVMPACRREAAERVSALQLIEPARDGRGAAAGSRRCAPAGRNSRLPLFCDPISGGGARPGHQRRRPMRGLVGADSMAS